ncbi:uncharacterized protein LOC133900613 [Phragmites australis]|uniref:uncharacterized protein LOC133900613 n=1 Tax=Phragmites australis TaxID=29695 RepID=UPI002D76B435|nr:uncharacterized protein LOC133900613 [Phragmites australis]
MPDVAGDRGQAKDGNIFNVWNHGFSIGQGFRCGFCGLSKKSGGATRLRAHLARIPGDVVSCLHTTSEVKHAMRKRYKEGKDRRKEIQKSKKRLKDNLVREMGGNQHIYVLSDEEEQIQMAKSLSLREYEFQQRVEMRGSTFHMDLVVLVFPILQHIRDIQRYNLGSNHYLIEFLVLSSLGLTPHCSRVRWKKLAQAWAKWFHANDISEGKASCPYFRASMRLTQELGMAGRLFAGSDIDGPCLDANYEDIEKALEDFKRDWKKYGVTIMCDSWTGPTSMSMSIINFMVYCHGRTFFHKTINASG